jgi:hypothetical protein
MEEFESKLIPVLRDGIDIIKMIFFKKLKSYLSRKYPERDSAYINKLSGAIINELFGVANMAEPFASFVNKNKDKIYAEMKDLSFELEEMLIPLTDALRIQFLCDTQEGIDSSSILARAKELNILISEREIPLPNHFMTLVRTLGIKFNLLNPIGNG